MKLYKLKNKSNHVRKFRDNNTGKNVFVNPKSEIITSQPQEESDIWGVSPIEESKNKEKKIHDTNKREDKK